MKANAILVCLMMMLSPAVHAQESTGDPGVTPDSFLYGLDVALDKIDLLLTFDQAEKSRKGLEIAQERLLEVRAMGEENKLDAIEKAQKEHDDAMENVASSLSKLEKENSTEELEDTVEIEKEFEEHKKRIEEVRGELEIKIKIKGEITPEQQALMDDILSRLEGTSGKVEIEIENKKEETKVKIKTETGKSDEEIESEVEEMEEREGLKELKMEKALDEIEDAKEEIEEARGKLEANATAPTLLAEAEKHLEKAEAAYSEGDYGEAYGQAKAAEEVAEDLKEELEEEEEEDEKKEELEIEVEIEEGKAEVEVEYGKDDLEFTLRTTDRAEIVSEIVDRTGITRAEIEAIIQFEEEDDHEQAFEVGNKTAKLEEDEEEDEKEKEDEEERDEDEEVEDKEEEDEEEDRED